MTKSTLIRFWRLLQSRPDLGDVEAAWRRDLKEEWDMVRSFFKPTDSLAKSYPCPSPGDVNCPRRIVQHEHDRFAAFCGQSPPECDALQLTRKDVIIHKFDIVGFSAQIARAFAFVVKPAQEHTSFHFLWRIGTYIPVEGRRFPVFLSLANEKESFLQALNHLLVSEKTSFVFLCPSDAYMDDAREKLLGEKNCIFIPLNETITWDGHDFSASRPANELLADFRASILPDGFVDAGHIAKLYMDGRARGATDAEVAEILGPTKATFDLVVDARSNKIWHPKIAPKTTRKFRLKYHVWVLQRLVEAKVPITSGRIGVLDRLGSDDDDNVAQSKTEQVQRTRSAIEPNSKRGQYRFIKTVQIEGDTTAYQWAPDAGLRYALIYPLESNE